MQVLRRVLDGWFRALRAVLRAPKRNRKEARAAEDAQKNIYPLW